ncbi:hypothetical protein [Neobacillus mesonae]|uniref:hypothetical protein n=1 Tax=Neobacillus mesonae TaxID=1193713 RepID=UPI002E1D7E6E|nr:hypothetical protein [Neobacillus mesonae]
MKKQDTVFELVQSDMCAKRFRRDYPVSEELRETMVTEIFPDFKAFALDQYYDDENLDIFQEFIDDIKPQLEKQKNLLDNLFWWKLFYEATEKSGRNCMEDYIGDHHFTLRNRPFFASWLRECVRMVPKFYFIGTKVNERYFIAVDILNQQTLEVIVPDLKLVPPKKGEIAVGTLMPLGGSLYFPISDFYRFNYEAREAIASCFHHHYEKHSKNATQHEAFLHVLSVMLQIEKIIHDKK